MDHEVSVQSVGRRSRRACQRSAAGDLRGARGPDYPWRGVAGSHSHVGGRAAATGAGEAGRVLEGKVVADVAARFPAPAETVLGPTSVGPRIFLCDGGRGR